MSTAATPTAANQIWIRDGTTGALLNTDDSVYRAILEKREEEKQKKLASERINKIESELSEIKTLLKQLINGK